MTNYEKIHNKNLSEMAEFLTDVANDCTECCIDCNGSCLECKERIIQWLNQEVKVTLSEAERVILENVPKEYKWIARDDWGNQLFVYTAKPIKNEIKGNWGAEGENADLELFNHLFQFITWEDDEPYNIEELLKGE